ncbi:polyphosphate kinase 2 [Dokdonella fugitiva]|uniref:polyphosphate kinase 2 n=1 Tax=Dokdonella fugitiva TaxID=328517 RepID=UPI0015FD54DB|nr:polyphosphate kinase 2 [Dokdonella fugitiva]MBA8884032.1 polyphosphate kinase 2 [Dokdonella fugitiva]
MKELKRKAYERALEDLYEDLVSLQRWIITNGKRVALVFEGRDAAGKGGVIKAISAPLNSRYTRIVALPKPTERESSQWYFQRYVEHLPAAGELVLFDRSWYNRAGVEHVMGFCTPAQYRRFLEDCPAFERLVTDDGLILLKYWLAVDQEYQEQRFAERASDPLKRFKISPVDLEARTQYAAYGAARDAMIAATDTPLAPWFVADFNDQRRGRLDVIRHLLARLPERARPDKPLKLPRLARKPAREHLADESLWIPKSSPDARTAPDAKKKSKD